MVEGLLRNDAYARAVFRHDLVHGAEAGGEHHLAIARAQRQFPDRHQRLQTVDLDVAREVAGGVGIGLDRDRPRAADAGGQHGVGADIGAGIEEQVALAQEMQHESHAHELVQAEIEIAGRTGHAAADDQPLAADPGCHDLGAETALEMPAGEPRPGSELVVARHRMGGERAADRE